MINKLLYAVWGGMFLFCAALGFLPDPQGFIRWLLIGCAVAFFIPPALLAADAWKKKDRRPLQLIRNLSIASLSLTLVMLVVNIASARAPRALGSALHILLGILSAPMFCAQSWIISLILWACLLWSCMMMLHRMKKN